MIYLILDSESLVNAICVQIFLLLTRDMLELSGTGATLFEICYYKYNNLRDKYFLMPILKFKGIKQALKANTYI